MKTPNETTKSWICDVDEEGLLIFPDELWELVGWKEGDIVEFIDQKDGSFILRKVEEELSNVENLDYTSTIEHA